MKNLILFVSLLMLFGCSSDPSDQNGQGGNDLFGDETVGCYQAYLDPIRNVPNLSDESYVLYNNLTSCFCGDEMSSCMAPCGLGSVGVDFKNFCSLNLISEEYITTEYFPRCDNNPAHACPLLCEEEIKACKKDL